MHAALLLVAALLGAETDPLAALVKPEEALPFTLDQIAAGAKNDAFVDEYLKDKSLRIFGQVQRIERVLATPPPLSELPADGQKPVDKPSVDKPSVDKQPADKPPVKSDGSYLLVMERIGHEDRAIDMQVLLQFDASARKELALLEPGVSKVTIEGTCIITQLTTLDRGVGFGIMLKDCKLIATPAGFEIGPRPPKTAVLPIITPPTAPVPTLPALPMLP